MSSAHISAKSKQQQQRMKYERKEKQQHMTLLTTQRN